MLSTFRNLLKSEIFYIYINFLRVKELLSLRKVKFVKELSGSYVFLGFQDNKKTGGGLKLQDLKIFSSPTSNYNTVYLLSSSLPYSFRDIIKKAKKARIKIIWNQNGIGFPAWAGGYSGKVNKNFKFGIQNANMVIFQSRFAMQSVNSLIISLENIPCKVIYNAVDLEVFKPKNISNNKQIRILVAGSHDNINRVLIALEIFTLLHKSSPNFLLWIAGKIKASDLKLVVDIVKSRGFSENVILYGQYGRKEAPLLFAEADILLHLQPFDACPTVVLEAMACGLVVVGPNNGALPEFLGAELNFQLLDNKTTYEQYDWGKPEAYAEKILSLIPMLGSLKMKARKRVEDDFDVRDWIKCHRKIFSDI